MKKILSLLLAFGLCTTGMAQIKAADQTTMQQAIVASGILSGDTQGNLNLYQTVTRAEFSKMLVTASIHKDSATGSSTSPFRDVSYTHWAAGYIKTAVSAGWLTGYLDGSYRPNNSVTLPEAASALLKVLGFTDFSGAYPQAQLTKAKSSGLSDGITNTGTLTRNDCITLFYNFLHCKDSSGNIYGKSLGLAFTEGGDLDYNALVLAESKGPYVATESGGLSLPFALSTATIYRNDYVVTTAAISPYDVYYYHAASKSLWLYSDKAIGNYTAATPSKAAPTAVSVGGKSYTLSTATAVQKLSALGGFAYGDTIALLLGRDGGVVDVVSASKTTGSYYGIVDSVALDSSTGGYLLKMTCTDGTARSVSVATASYTAGNLVSVSFSGSGTTVTRLSEKTLSGSISADGKRAGDYTLATDVKILEAGDTEAQVVYPSRIAGLSLGDNLRYYVLNESGQISHLILDDVTGDLYDYGIVTTVSESASSMNLSSSYGYIIGGQSGNFSGNNAVYNLDMGGAIFYRSSGTVSSIKNLNSLSLETLSQTKASGGGKSYAVAENVQIYLKKDSNYSLSTLSKIEDVGKFTLKAYYDTGFAAGGQIRIVVATEKTQ